MRYLLPGLLFVLPVSAVTVRSGENTVVIGPAETIEDSLVASGQTVRIDGKVDGDAVVFAQRVEINGEIQGNLIAFAQNIAVIGPVKGSTAAFAQVVTVGGELGRNLLAGGQDVRVERDGRVRGDIVAFGSTVVSEGAVSRGIRVFANSARVGGTVGRNVDFSGDEIEVLNGAVILGDVHARVRDSDRVRVAAGAVRGKVDTWMPPAEAEREQQAAGGGVFFRVMWEILWLGAAFFAGWLLYRLAPRFMDRTAAAIDAGPAALGLGFAVTFLAPVAILFALLTIIGIPLALIGAALFGAALYLAKIAVAFWIGRRVWYGGSGLGRLAAGLAIVSLVLAVPFAGWLARLIVTCAGIGGMALALRASTPPVAAPPAPRREELVPVG
ncbi:MAG: polymer-forming cytoskeletal protein [Bryobacteraceae bacterium]